MTLTFIFDLDLYKSAQRLRGRGWLGGGMSSRAGFPKVGSTEPWGSVSEAEGLRKPFLKEDQMLYMEKLNGCRHLIIDLFYWKEI